jgi:hypothetical protein
MIIIPHERSTGVIKSKEDEIGSACRKYWSEVKGIQIFGRKS